ncbi:DUF397 domain-containing protein [Streptomyces cellulosae]
MADLARDCVEVAVGVPGSAPVRDSKLASDSPVVLVGSEAWRAFIRTVGAARF